MVLVDAVMHFGKAVANAALEVCRPDIFIGRDLHCLAGTIRGMSDESRDIPFSSIEHDGNLIEEKPACCLKCLHGKLDEKSVIAVVLPLESDSTAVKEKSFNKQLAFAELYRDGAKRFLNATNSLPQHSRRGFHHHTLGEYPASEMDSSMKRTRFPSSKSEKSTGDHNYRKICAEWCGEDRCDLMRKESLEKPSMWMDPDCYSKLVCERPFRYDVVHMPGSDKATREYQRTWIECPPIHIVRKPVCCTEPLELPPICRRPRKVRPTTATHCKPGPQCQKETPCPKKKSPCCPPARDDPCCKIFPTPSCCHKRCTPFPSFSECCRPDFNKKVPVECFCLARPTLCEIYEDWRKRFMTNPPSPFKFNAFPENNM